MVSTWNILQDQPQRLQVIHVPDQLCPTLFSHLGLSFDLVPFSIGSLCAKTCWPP